jgi:hypothetical protein
MFDGCVYTHQSNLTPTFAKTGYGDLKRRDILLGVPSVDLGKVGFILLVFIFTLRIKA